MTQRNWPLLIQVTEHIINHPGEWSQSTYVSESGTEFCFAGLAAKLSGCTPILNHKWARPRFDTCYMRVPEDLKPTLFAAGWQPGPMADIASALFIGSTVLGVDGEDRKLFSGKNTTEDIFAILDEWAIEDGFPLHEHVEVPA